MKTVSKRILFLIINYAFLLTSFIWLPLFFVFYIYKEAKDRNFEERDLLQGKKPFWQIFTFN